MTDDVDAAIILPRLDQYVNRSEWVFHLRQLPEVWELGRGWTSQPRKLKRRSEQDG